MSYEKRDNSGTLGKNDRREKDTHPTHAGKCVIEGKEFWISAWVKEGPSGKFFSLAFKPKEVKAQEQQRSQPEEEFSDDIPF
jgi:hypothetical protein